MLTPETGKSFDLDNSQKYHVLMALEERPDINAVEMEEMKRLFQAGITLAITQKASSFTLLGLILVPEGQSLSEGAIPAQTQRALLDDVVAHYRSPVPLEIKTQVRVCSAGTPAQELNDVILDGQINLLLLGWGWFSADIANIGKPSPLEEVLRRPLCDLAVIGPGVDVDATRKILLAARGGPFAELALRLACNVAEQNDGQVTLLHVSRYMHDGDEYYLEEEMEESAYALLGRNSKSYNRITRRQVANQDVQEAIIQEAQNHDLILLGATATVSSSRAGTVLQNPFGPVARAVFAQQSEEERRPGVILVRAGAPRDFYFSRLQRRKQQIQIRASSDQYISELVDKWFAENTFDASEFQDIERLIASKKTQGLTISLGLPALNEEETIGDVICAIKTELFDKYPLLDEIVLIDSNSSDRTRQIAEDLGIPVHIHQMVLPEQGALRGKGEALWKSLYVLKGDIIAWVDTDVSNMHPRFIYGLVGPLLKNPHLQYVKGYYRRPIQVGDTIHETGGGRVTELTVRPLFNLFFPELSGIIQPLSGEYAGRRACLEQLPFFTGYGVETGHLIDILDRVGLPAIGQVNLRERRHRNQDIGSLSQMAFAITQVIVNRLEEREKLQLTNDINRTMKLINLSPVGLKLDLRHIEDRERPPMLEVPEYRQKHRQRLNRIYK
jgi:glucosyl-3-phosphoglycerate synthase